ncbi:MAG: hypothetical protein P9E24_15030 [Candidatus Competibacter sp.]|nr:hypothetical protein [Candidatus Competibacter sp.]MDG4583490.1 hypothetical protein [Candidatus Competibacter sp.]
MIAHAYNAATLAASTIRVGRIGGKRTAIAHPPVKPLKYALDLFLAAPGDGDGVAVSDRNTHSHGG